MVTSQGNRRSSSFSSSTTSSLAKRQATVDSRRANDGCGFAAGKAVTAKKRTPLGELTNVGRSGLAPSCAKNPKSLVSSVTKQSRAARTTSTSNLRNNVFGNSSSHINVRPHGVFVSSQPSIPRTEERVARVPTPCIASISPSRSESDTDSVSMDESMSTCDSYKSPDVEYIDNNEVSLADSINRKTFSGLHISETGAKTVKVCERDFLVNMETDKKIVDIDDNYTDPQLCATIACDIYQHLRASEARRRPSTDFMERIQKDVTASMRAILIDWLVEVAEEYRLVPDTLFLTVNYIDRYLSGNPMNRQRLQLLGVACMMIASKYEEICAPQVEEFCYITDNTYFKGEVLQMESAVLNYLKFELTAPTAKCFLRRFIQAAHGVTEVPVLQLECMANFLAELTLLEYNMLSYPPSLIAASAIFLAKYILIPSKRPWDSTLQHYTQYQPSDLCSCVKVMHNLCMNCNGSTLPAIREKYSQHKYKFVAKKYCPPSIPEEFFQQ
ncbi:hypothetical protein MLD38_001443 [Melastoma candidum]|uniref:Uncharacterized protein n=1 Tax=Melastoma candidum TaxID=119954 RepID=A0ACB9SCN1_9MYRT|nr:hypothetical protein MLD38_001443 [Melastoma candidum]